MLVLQAIAEGKIHTVVITTVEKNIALLHIQNNWVYVIKVERILALGNYLHNYKKVEIYLLIIILC